MIRFRSIVATLPYLDQATRELPVAIGHEAQQQVLGQYRGDRVGHGGRWTGLCAIEASLTFRHCIWARYMGKACMRARMHTRMHASMPFRW